MILTQLNSIVNYGWHVSKAFIKFYICVCLNLSIRSECIQGVRPRGVYIFLGMGACI